MGGRGKDGRGFFCGCNDIFCSPLRYRNSHWQFLQIRDSFLWGEWGWMGKQNGKSIKITSKGNYSEKSCIFAFENKT
jgi:hypothetical protein